MRLESILGNVVLFFLLVSFAFALWTSTFFLGGFSDVFHVVEHAHGGNVDQDVQWSVMSAAKYSALFAIFQLVCLGAFAVERKWRLDWSYGVLFLILGILSILWGAFHLWVALRTYAEGMTLADELKVTNVSGSLATIYGTYALVVGLPWVLTGVLVLVFAYKDH